jgi:hypothetical protein
MGSTGSSDAFQVRRVLPGGWVVVQHSGGFPSLRRSSTILRTKAEQERIEAESS